MYTMALWKWSVIFLYVYTSFDNVYSQKKEPIDQLSIKMRFLELENEILQLKARDCGQNKELDEILRLVKTPNIAFRSALSSDIGQVTPGQIIVFDIVGLNNGNAYNQHSGIFTAPVNGTYMFSMKLGNPSGNPSAFFLVQSHGSTKQYLEYVIAGHTSEWNVGGTSTVTQMVEGESVWVEGEGSPHGKYGDHRYHTTFAGILLHLV
ncbi:hypothetical protein ACF0H5_023651 [Mactra antiquata]